MICPFVLLQKLHDTSGRKQELKAHEHVQRCAILDAERLSCRDLVSFVVDVVPVTCESGSTNYVRSRNCQLEQVDRLARLVCYVLRVLCIRCLDLATSREVKEGIHAYYDLWTIQVPTRSKFKF